MCLLFLFFLYFLCAYVCAGRVITLSFILILILPRRVTRRFRIANHMVMDSCCRGGIVDTRGGCSRALFVPPKSPKAIWRFRASTSNSPSGRTWPQTDTALRYIYYIYAQQDIRVCGDDHFQPPNGSTRIPRRFGFFA